MGLGSMFSIPPPRYMLVLHWENQFYAFHPPVYTSVVLGESSIRGVPLTGGGLDASERLGSDTDAASG